MHLEGLTFLTGLENLVHQAVIQKMCIRVVENKVNSTERKSEKDGKRERETRRRRSDCLTFDLGVGPGWPRRANRPLLVLAADTGCDICFPGTREKGSRGF